MCRKLIEITILLSIFHRSFCDINPAWVDPHGWELHDQNINNEGETSITKYDQCNYNCPEPQNIELKEKISMHEDKNQDKLADLFYKKLVNFLFDEKKMIHDDANNLFMRTLHLQIKPEQLQKLRAAKTPRDIDSIVSEIIHDSRGGTLMMAKEILLTWAEYFHYLYMSFMRSAKVQFISLFITALLSSWYVSRWSGRSIIFVWIGFIFLTSYVATYMECNRKLEIEKLVYLMELKGKQSPCDIKKSESMLSKFFTPNFSRNECVEHLMIMYGNEVPICNAAEVFVEFVTNLIFKHIAVMVEKILGIFMKLISSLGFPQNLILGIAFLLYIFFLTRDILVQLIKSSFGAICHLRATVTPQRQPQILDDPARDRLSGANLEKLIGFVEAQRQLTEQIAVSSQLLREIPPPPMEGNYIQILSSVATTSENDSDIEIIESASQMDEDVNDEKDIEEIKEVLRLTSTSIEHDIEVKSINSQGN